MTSGITDINTRQATAFPWVNCSGSGTFNGAIGWKTTRSWGGADYPSTSPKPSTTVHRGDRYPVGGSRRLPRRAYLVDHAYSLTAKREFNGPASWDEPKGACAPGVFTTYTVGHLEGFGPGFPTYVWGPNQDLEVMKRLQSAIAGSAFNLAVAAAETAPALVMIAKAARDLNRAYGSVRRGDLVGCWRNLTGLGRIPSRVRRTLIHENAHDAKVVASNWLAMQYGWRPLLNDVYDAARTLAHFLNTPLVKSYRANFSNPGFGSTSSPSNFEFNLQKVFTRKQIIARVREASVPALLGLTNPASLVWEKLPFSFVADWFLPISSYLQARGLASALQWATFVTSKKDYSLLGEATTTAAGAAVYRRFESSYSVESCVFSRTVNNSLSVPFPQLVPLGKWATWNHAANAVALVITNWGSWRRGK